MSSVTNPRCASDDQLRHFLEGRMSPVSVEELAGHCESCERCASRLEELEAESDGVAFPFDLNTPASSDDSDSHSDVIERALDLNEGLMSGVGSRLTALSDGIGKDDRLGEYRVIREVERGGMGIVYEAEQTSLGRRVALKVLPGNVTTAQRLRFENEARAVAQLHHTNIVPVFGVGDDSGTLYYAMQYIDGVSLDRVLETLRQSEADPRTPTRSSLERLEDRETDAASEKITRDLIADDASGVDSASRHSSLDLSGSRSDIVPYWKSIARIGMQVGDAVQYAHDQNITHRDIKPANLLVDQQLNVWVADFGLAKMGDENNLTHSGDILGTIRSIAPEVLEGEASRASDVYSLGITLYELVTLQPAFEGDNKQQLIREVTSSAPIPIRRCRSDVPADLATIVHKAIERDRADRYRSAGDLAEDLRRFLNDDPIRARRTSLFQHFRRWARRNRGLAASLLGIFVLMGFIAVASVGVAVHFRETGEQIARS